MISNCTTREKRSATCPPITSTEMRPQSGTPSSTTSPPISRQRACSATNRTLKSKYSSTEINKNSNICNLPSKKNEETKIFVSNEEEERTKDILFLRKMLVMNKKQEIMLNKRLAKLLEEEDGIQSLAGGSEKSQLNEKPSLPKLEVQNATDSTQPTSENKCLKSTKESFHQEEKSINEKTPIKNTKEQKMSNGTSKKTASVKKVEYDLNGRRIYHYDDVEDDIKDGENVKVEPNKTSVHMNNSTESSRKGSAGSKKTFAMNKSVTFSYINNQNPSARKPTIKCKKIRKEDGDSPEKSNLDVPLDPNLRPKNAGGEGYRREVQNVVVHCSTVVGKSSTGKKNLKVWNYKSLHSLNSVGKGSIILPDKVRLKGESDKHNRPISVSNNNIQIEISNPPNSERGSKTVETEIRVRNKFSDGHKM